MTLENKFVEKEIFINLNLHIESLKDLHSSIRNSSSFLKEENTNICIPVVNKNCRYV